MSKLREEVVGFINELGDKAPEFFGKSKATIKSWLATGNVPLYAVEKVVDATSGATDNPVDSTAPAPTAAETFYPQPEAQPTWQSEVERLLNEFQQAIHSLHQRLSFLEGNGPANAPQFQPPPSQRGAGQQVFEPAPRDSNVGSMVRPGGAVLGTITTPANATGRKPSDGWLKPRPLRQIVTQ